mmetsp:Transcript_28666/g.62544  ORF Transcript_28666/g.62544 Transcript_28666/m.62544 type:complete len:317 (+) Transcript_28666:852-1802(+)
MKRLDNLLVDAALRRTRRDHQARDLVITNHFRQIGQVDERLTNLRELLFIIVLEVPDVTAGALPHKARGVHQDEFGFRHSCLFQQQPETEQAYGVCPVEQESITMQLTDNIGAARIPDFGCTHQSCQYQGSPAIDSIAVNGAVQGAVWKHGRRLGKTRKLDQTFSTKEPDNGLLDFQDQHLLGLGAGLNLFLRLLHADIERVFVYSRVAAACIQDDGHGEGWINSSVGSEDVEQAAAGGHPPYAMGPRRVDHGAMADRLSLLVLSELRLRILLQQLRHFATLVDGDIATLRMKRHLAELLTCFGNIRLRADDWKQY